MPKRQVNFRLDEELHDQLKERASAEGCNVIDLVVPLLRRAVEEHTPVDGRDGTQEAGDPEFREGRVKVTAVLDDGVTAADRIAHREHVAEALERNGYPLPLSAIRDERLAVARSSLPDPSEVGAITQRAKELVREEGLPMPQAMARARREATSGPGWPE